VIPLFPELQPHLELCFEQAEPGAEFVITRYRRPNSNLRTLFMKIIRRAGLKPWPKLFQNLRSTRETELADQFPIQVVCDWIGNTEAIASKHYLQVTEDHFAKALQNALQHPAVLPRTGSQAGLPAHKQTPVLQGGAAGCEAVQSGRVEDRGLEPQAFPRGNRQVAGQGGSESGSVGDENAPTNPTLVSLIKAWPALPPDTKSAILAIVEAAQGR
jgi:hypothetical protein